MLCLDCYKMPADKHTRTSDGAQHQGPSFAHLLFAAMTIAIVSVSVLVQSARWMMHSSDAGIADLPFS